MQKIAGLRRIESSLRRLGGNGDNWHMTWASDDKVYTGLCDGKGWPHLPQASYNSRAYAIVGAPPELQFEFLPGYPELLNVWDTRECSRYYAFGTLAVGERIYQFLSSPNRPFTEAAPRFVGAKLIYSPDLGRTWLNQDGSAPVRWEGWDERSRGNMAFFEEDGDAFALTTVLQMGQDYRLNRDGFVYIYAPNGNTEGTMNETALCRVPKDQVLDRADYTFFAGQKSGKAQWSSQIADRAPVHSFPAGWVNTKVHPYAWHPSVVYYEPTGEYLMANWGMGTDADGMWFVKPSYLGFWTALEPWGPWRQVHEDTAWTPGGDAAARCYQPQIAPKWIAADGRSFWLMWTDFQLVDNQRPHYAFNLQPVDVTLK
ncbi:MAG: DUF4185 domain-containing protein [Planctomycetota bacterium]